MLRSLYIAGTGMITQRARMNVLTNDISNADTSGYKSDQTISRSFPDMLLSRLNDPNIIARAPQVGPLNTGIHIDEIITDFEQGPMEQTGLITDLAITGRGFFAVQTPQGVQYTRNGAFQVNLNGELVTQDGYYVLNNAGGRINVGTSGDFSVNANGAITANGQVVGTLGIYTFQTEGGLRKQGNNNFTHINNEAPTLTQNTVLMQGFLEGSNVDIAKSTVDMLMINRVYESNQRILKMVDESLARTVNDIAKF